MPNLPCMHVPLRHTKDMVELLSNAAAKSGSGKVQQDKLCGNSKFFAAGDRAASAKGKVLSGRFILSCSHLMVLRMVNMPAAFGGERYAYAYIMAAGEFYSSSLA